RFDCRFRTSIEIKNRVSLRGDFFIMKNTVIITGVSSGMGFALVKHYLEQNCFVVGIGRTNDFEAENYVFHQCDLSQNTSYDFLKDYVYHAECLILINNAGVIGNIERISEQEISDIKQVMQVNTIAPMLLCQFVLREFPLNRELTIVNISSGAGKRPMPSWAAYCASKAAIDLFSQTIYLEELERGRMIKVYSVAPGVVDTPMQDKIRKSKPQNFS